MDVAVYAVTAAIVLALVGAGIMIRRRATSTIVKCIHCKHKQRVSARRATYVCKGCDKKMRHHTSTRSGHSLGRLKCGVCGQKLLFLMHRDTYTCKRCKKTLPRRSAVPRHESPTRQGELTDVRQVRRDLPRMPLSGNHRQTQWAA